VERIACVISCGLQGARCNTGGVRTGCAHACTYVKTSAILGRVSLIEPEAPAARQQLDRVLEGSLFGRSEQLSRLLRFLVERHLEGRDDELKESVIGVEVFGRKPDYNPKFDPIVRTEARRLRARLGGYYGGEGKDDALVIDIPKGGYVPTIRQRPRRASHRPVPRHWIATALACLMVALALAGWTRLKPGSDQPVSKADAEAYDLYLRARAFEMQSALRGVEESIGLFEQATTKDPSFASAYAGIAAGEAARSAFDRFDVAERAGMIAKGWAFAEKAIQLDRLSADAQDALGMMQAREAQWEPAERSFQRAVDLAPSDPLWRNHFAMFLLLPLGRVEDALRQLRIAEEIDPLSPQTHDALSLALRAGGRFDEAEFHCQKAAENDQQRSECWAQTLVRQGKTEQALRILETTWSGHLLQAGAQALGVAYARAGRREDAERIAALLPRPASKAQIFAALGDKDRTFDALYRMAPMGPTRIGRDFLISPNLAFLRGDPRLNALRKKVGLPEYRDSP
jgi:tetratricopeptide (TPR) repeat protein